MPIFGFFWRQSMQLALLGAVSFIQMVQPNEPKQSLHKGKGSLERPKSKWEDNIKVDLKDTMSGLGWVYLYEV
jgi:hypothetical protein